MAEEIIKLLEYLQSKNELIGIAKIYFCFQLIVAVLVIFCAIFIFVKVFKSFKNF